MSNEDARLVVNQIFTEYLVAHAFRKTPERFAILEEIYSRDGHFDIESLFNFMKDKNYRVSRARGCTIPGVTPWVTPCMTSGMTI